MALTKDDLLKPRYKVILDFPGNRFKIGAIFTKDIDGTYVDEENNVTIESNLTAFPHLFRKLEWHEDREPDQMPKYVWYDDTPSGEKKKKLIVLKVDEWIKEPDGEIWARVNGDNIGFATMHMSEPATESDYNSQKQTTNG